MSTTRPSRRFWWIWGLVALSLSACDPFLYGGKIGPTSGSVSRPATAPTGNTTPAQSGPAAENMADLASQLATLQAQVQKLEGQIEENRHRLDQLQKAGSPPAGQKQDPLPTLKNKLQLLEARLARLEGQPGTTAPAAQKAPVAPTSPASPRLSPKTTPPPIAKAKPTPPVTSDNQVFKEGIALFKKKSYPRAREKFKKYLRDHPEGAKAVEARYYLADTFYQERKLNEAIVEFNKVVDQHPKSLLAPPALLKQAYAFKAQGKTKVYKLILEKLIDDYPQSAAAHQGRRLLRTGPPASEPTAPAPTPKGSTRIRKKGE